MLDFGGTSFYIDLTSMEKLMTNKVEKNEQKTSKQIKEVFGVNGELISTEIVTSTIDKEDEINITKLETINLMIDVLMANKEEMDTSLGLERALSNADLSFQIAFNTLYNYKILREK